jgi:hypothetical protein
VAARDDDLTFDAAPEELAQLAMPNDDSSFDQLDEFPVGAFSASSVATFLTCPEKFRAKYVLREVSGIGGGAVLGSAFHHARRTGLEHKLSTGQDLTPSDIADAYSDGWEQAIIGRPVEWGSDKPEALKDAGYIMVTKYADEVAPTLEPAEVEVRFNAYVPGVPIPVIGYLDLVTTDGTVIDTKTSKSATRNPLEHWRVQALIYMNARRSTFEWHTISRPRKSDGECTIHTPATSPSMRLVATAGRINAGGDLVREAAAGVKHLMTTRGPYEVWPGTGILHSYACSTCDHRPSCRWLV